MGGCRGELGVCRGYGGALRFGGLRGGLGEAWGGSEFWGGCEGVTERGFGGLGEAWGGSLIFGGLRVKELGGVCGVWGGLSEFWGAGGELGICRRGLGQLPGVWGGCGVCGALRGGGVGVRFGVPEPPAGDRAVPLGQVEPRGPAPLPGALHRRPPRPARLPVSTPKLSPPTLPPRPAPPDSPEPPIL